MNNAWFYSSPDARPLHRCCIRISTSALRARLLTLPWKRPFFPAPFPWRISNTLQMKENRFKIDAQYFLKRRMCWCLLLWSQLSHELTGSSQQKQARSFLFPNSEESQRFLRGKRKLKIFTQLHKLSSHFRIVPRCLIHWQ